MTSPLQQAPNGYLADGSVSDSVENTRDAMISQFDESQNGLKSNTDYYESTSRPEAIGVAVPQAMRKLLAQVGYPRLYVDAIAERLEIEGFLLGGQTDADTDLWDWWQANDLDVEATLGYADALVHGRSYITISQPDPKVDLNVDPAVPIIRVEPPTSLFATIDPRTREVSQAIRTIYDADGAKVVMATLYLPMQTLSWVRDDAGELVPYTQANHGLGVVPVVPMPNRTRLSDLYGTSQITPELRSVTDAAARIMMDMQATAEMMAIPQRILFGIKPEEIGVDPATGKRSWDAYLAQILAFEDPNGKSAQFSAAELRNFVDAIDALDKKAAAYTGLPPQYLSSSSENPASAEAIRAAESRLVKIAERKAKIFGGAWEKAMRIAYMMMKGGQIPPQYLRMESLWRDPSTPTYAAKADAASKLYNQGTGVIPKERARIDMGYSVEERIQMQEWDKQESAALQLAGLLTPTTPTPERAGAAKPTPAGNPTSAAKPTETKSQSPQT